ncbi:NAD(P)H:quinone oxidoreductase [Alteromonas sp. 345S023]|uniref:NAD(P)H:quinone oxidoreductase n=1 Tax=Alteromonas profundi TaxID=2696062 RepID=A0A7X5LP12_9ALTE|nr:NAD(P)H:quinone oxidoreductase [Alteromonas profundi]NDV92906.1 NAD(P)H:quinone oxidoreductase [Alteromonas profundi]
MAPILVLYYSHHGSTKKLADAIAQGIVSEGGEVWVRTVKSLHENNASGETAQSLSAPEVTRDELAQCSGLALGSPTRFGNMAAAVKHFLDSTSAQWIKGDLINKPACVFTSTSSMHGGQESTLLSMMVPLLHHGMVMCGIPYSEPALHDTVTGGTPYGVTHVANSNNTALSDHEKALCLAQGKRLAQLAKALYSQFSENNDGA